MLKILAPFFLIVALSGCQTNKMSSADIGLLEKAVDVSMHEYMSCMERAALEVSNTLSTATEAAIVAHSQCSVEFNRTELLFRESLLAQISWRNTQMAYDTTSRVMTRLKTEMMAMVTEIVVKKRSSTNQTPKSKAKEQSKF